MARPPIEIGIPHHDPLHSSKDGLPTMPTMYDLPSEDPEEPGLPDEFHIMQPQLLRETFSPPNHQPQNVFVATDLNLYFDQDHTLWHKRPDWFAVIGVSRLYDGWDLRLSYVMWQERKSPLIIVELLSPGTETEDLGQTTRDENAPPTKWEVYEQILKVPYYVVFNRYDDELKIFKLVDGQYQEIELKDGQLWMPEIELGLGLWHGRYQGIERLWLRWYDKADSWILNPAERAEQEHQRAEQERERAERERQRAEQADQQVKQANQRVEQANQRVEQANQRVEQAEQQAEQERQRAERLAAKMREMGLDPDQL